MGDPRNRSYGGRVAYLIHRINELSNLPGLRAAELET